MNSNQEKVNYIKIWKLIVTEIDGRIGHAYKSIQTGFADDVKFNRAQLQETIEKYILKIREAEHSRSEQYLTNGLSEWQRSRYSIDHTFIVPVGMNSERNTIYYEHRTLLHLAVKFQCLNLVRALLKARACPTISGDNIQEMLINQFATHVPNPHCGSYTPLDEACHIKCDNEIAVKIIERLAGVSAPIINKKCPRTGNTPLHNFVRCSENNNEFAKQALEILIKAGADPNIKNRKGETPLDIIKGSKNFTLLEVLGHTLPKQESERSQLPVNNPIYGFEETIETYGKHVVDTENPDTNTKYTSIEGNKKNTECSIQ